MSNNVKKSKKLKKGVERNGNSDDILNLASEKAGFHFEKLQKFFKRN